MGAGPGTSGPQPRPQTQGGACSSQHLRTVRSSPGKAPLSLHTERLRAPDMERSRAGLAGEGVTRTGNVTEAQSFQGSKAELVPRRAFLDVWPSSPDALPPGPKTGRHNQREGSIVLGRPGATRKEGGSSWHVLGSVRPPLEAAPHTPRAPRRQARGQPATWSRWRAPFSPPAGEARRARRLSEPQRLLRAQASAGRGRCRRRLSWR